MKRATGKPSDQRSRFAIALLLIGAVGVSAIWFTLQRARPVAISLPADAPIPAAQGYVRGDSSAPILITEFADFECPSCQQFAMLQEPDVIAKLVNTGIAQFRFMDFPLTDLHGNTMVAHLAAACASDQGRFWAMHDRLFLGQADWSTPATRDPRRVIDVYAREIGLDLSTYDGCISSRKHLPQIEANRRAGLAAGVAGTPSISINNQLYPRTLNYDQIKRVVDSLRSSPAPATLPKVSDR